MRWSLTRFETPSEFSRWSLKITYLYDANSVKLRKCYYEDNHLMETTDYYGNFVYTDDHLDYILTSEGRLKWNAQDHVFNAEFFIKDHLGNIRSVIITDTSQHWLAQGTDYYPFGMEIPIYGNNDYNQLKYNGKELQTDAGLEWYDYGARFYDPVIGRWNSVDPLAAERSWVSPYSFCQNNPLIRVDPNGALDNPIYDWGGNFLGTDDKGLQGEAIIMNKSDFTQGMSHDNAMAVGFTLDNMSSDNALNFANNGNFSNFQDHYNSLSSRPDWDGVVTIKEGVSWAKSHPNLRASPDDVNYLNATTNDALYLDVSKMDFGRLSTSDFNNVDIEQGINLLKFVNGNPRSRFTTYALGRTRMTLQSTAFGGIVTVSNGAWNAYDWDYGGNLLRESLIFGERTLKRLNDSHGFPIQVYGSGLLNR